MDRTPQTADMWTFHDESLDTSGLAGFSVGVRISRG